MPKYTGLDNLPNEVQFLLDEIRYKETRAQGEFGVFFVCHWHFDPVHLVYSCGDATRHKHERVWVAYIHNFLNLILMSAYYLSTVGGEPLLSFRRVEIQLEIQKDTARYIRHSQKTGTPKEGKENGKDKDSKDSLIPGRVKLAHEEYDKLCVDKINLAARLVETLARVYARLDHDTTKVIALSGEPPQEQYEVRNGYIVGPAQSSTAAPAVLTGGNVLAPTSGIRQVKEVQESLRAALASDVVVGTPVLSAGPAQKREPQFNFGRRGQHWLTI